MKVRRLFPLGKAYGKAFCNREEETERLIGNIESGKHTYLVAPRRYGKSSLCENVFASLKISSAKLDFHLAITEKNVENSIINGVTDLIGKSVGRVKKLEHIIKKYAKKLTPKAIIGVDHAKIELSVAENSNPAENIAEALLLLEKLLQGCDKQSVLLLDEFQEIGLMKEGKGIEGAIRHVAQETQNLSFVFSGSNPLMLEAMFEDERRPLYKLCRKIVLDRIHEEHYKPHLNKAAKERWGKELSDELFKQIMSLTERHPYYVNYLCDEVWLDNDKFPMIKDIKKAWDRVVEEERSDLLKDFFLLSENQRKLMIYIAKQGGKNLYASDVAVATNMPSGSLARTITSLLEKNYIEKTEECYRIIIPVFNQLLAG